MGISASEQCLSMIGVMGGTFDPIHYGHLRTALEVAEAGGFERVHFIPGHVPPHREQPIASAQQRLAMVQLATAHEPLFHVDDRELRREGASYTVDTLESLRAELGAAVPIAFLMGDDAFVHFQSWHRWQDILKLANIVVMQRPGQDEQTLPNLPSLLAGEGLGMGGKYKRITELTHTPAGSIARFPVTQLAISATFIRKACAQGDSIRYLLPDAVVDYLRAHQLYEQQIDFNGT